MSQSGAPPIVQDFTVGSEAGTPPDGTACTGDPQLAQNLARDEVCLLHEGHITGITAKSYNRREGKVYAAVAKSAFAHSE
jgi:hypothetical protein